MQTHPQASAPPLPIQISASAVDDFRTCAYRYAMCHIHRVPEAERDAVTLMSYGTAIHKTIAAFFRLGGWTRIGEAELTALLPHFWQGGDYATPDIAAANFERAEVMLRTFHRMRYPQSVARELGVERRVAWRRYRQGVLAVGRFDRALLLPNGDVEIIDYKTGRRTVEAADLLSDSQALIYRSLGADVFRTLSPPNIRTTFFFVASGVPVTADFERDDFEAGWARVLKVVARIREAIHEVAGGAPVAVAFPPTPGERCRWCPLRTHCSRAFGEPRPPAAGAAAGF